MEAVYPICSLPEIVENNNGGEEVFISCYWLSFKRTRQDGPSRRHVLASIDRNLYIENRAFGRVEFSC